MVRAFLIRVGMDSVCGGFVSPIFRDDKRTHDSYVFLPIPNTGREGDTSSKELKRYSESRTNSNLPLTDFLPKDKLEVKKQPLSEPQKIPVHNDPEFATMTYGGNKQKKVIYNNVKDFSKGDYIVFYAAFFRLPDPDFRYNIYNLSQLQKLQKKNKEYHIIAFLELKYPPIYRSNYKDYIDEIGHNAHYLRGDFERHDDSFILKGTSNSGWTEQ